ncbi:hypothetical protein LBMAG42_12030 [Deltaproteobacteria bacterium]|nr:hypothetical protein LBMAG42_12030 [Deltaproteobacteria bacterium]
MVVCVLAFNGPAHERYLYFVSLLFVGTICGFLHSLVFAGYRWDDPWEPHDAEPKANWRENAPPFIKAVLIACGASGAIWAVLQLLGHDGLKSGGWYLFYVAVFTPFLVATWSRLKFVNFRAAVPTVLIMDLVLSGYEYLLLKEGTGWAYNGTIIGWIYVVPIENVLFIYPVAGALVCVLFSVVSRHLNDFKAFWLLMGGLTCIFVPVEIIGIGWLKLWDVDQFKDQSVLPIWHTNLEEFVYYLLFQALAGLLYVWFDQNLRPSPRARYPGRAP